MTAQLSIYQIKKEALYRYRATRAERRQGGDIGTGS